MILAIDPGSEQSAYVILNDNLKPIEFGKLDNQELLEMIAFRSRTSATYTVNTMAIEMVASYGMAVGAEVFETVWWTGRFWEAGYGLLRRKIYRKDEKMNLCHSMKANDSNIRQALIDRFGVVGTKKAQGWFYGVSKDVWAAIAVGVTYHDMYLQEAAK
jgi:hypothetical protein